jgi:hypothetical protein
VNTVCPSGISWQRSQTDHKYTDPETSRKEERTERGSGSLLTQRIQQAPPIPFVSPYPTSRPCLETGPNSATFSSSIPNRIILHPHSLSPKKRAEMLSHSQTYGQGNVRKMRLYLTHDHEDRAAKAGHLGPFFVLVVGVGKCGERLS